MAAAAGGGAGATGADGDKFNTSTTTSITIQPTLNQDISFNIGPNYAYIPGNSVIVVDSTTINNRFEGTVLSYNTNTGIITITGITNIKGTYSSGSQIYNVNLDGIDGPTGAYGPTGPQGPTGLSGNMFNTATTNAVIITPATNGQISLTVSSGLSYIPGN